MDIYVLFDIAGYCSGEQSTGLTYRSTSSSDYGTSPGTRPGRGTSRRWLWISATTGCIGRTMVSTFLFSLGGNDVGMRLEKSGRVMHHICCSVRKRKAERKKKVNENV